MNGQFRSTVQTLSGWFQVHARVSALFAAVACALAGFAGLAMSVTASAQASPIKHIVVLYLENHTFDNLLGFWCDQHRGRCPDGGMPSSINLSGGLILVPHTMPDVVPAVQHTVAAQRTAIDGGKMDGWAEINGCHATNGYACIAGYTPAQIPNLARLAGAFAISDHTYSMTDSPSWGGHLYAVMASTDRFLGDNPRGQPGTPLGPGWGCDSNRIERWVSPQGTLQWAPSCIPDFSLGLPNGGAFEPTPAKYLPTIMDRLSAAGLSWRIYGEPTPNKTGGIDQGYVWDICPSFAECLDTSQLTHNVQSANFIHDAQAGHLANFSIVTPGGVDVAASYHNGFSETAGDNWLGQVASAVMTGPEWSSTALFITWDDCGCFYDQVPPGRNPDGTMQGPRVPLVIVSPYARPRFTDRTATTFAGILAYTEQTFGLAALGANDTQAYPFTNAFNYSQPPLAPVRMVTRAVPRGDHINWKEANQGT